MHLPGVLYCALGLAVLLVAINTQQNLVFWVFGVMLSGVLISGVVSGMMMMGLEVQRVDPEHGVVDEPLTVQYALTNRNRFIPIFNINIEEIEPPMTVSRRWPRLMASARAWIMHIGPGETVHGEAVFWPTHRGEAQFESIRIWTTFPFGLIKKSLTLTQSQHTLVYPKLYEMRRDVMQTVRPAGALGMRASRRAGSGEDYFGLREYRPGDSARQIAWKRMATYDQIITIERTEPSPPKVRVLVNLADPLPDDERERDAALEAAERAISLAASIVRAADLEGFEVGLHVLGSPAPPIPPRRNHWHMTRLFGALAQVDVASLDDTPTDQAVDPTPSSGGLARTPGVDRAGVIVIHPTRRMNTAIGGADAWHFSAANMEDLVVSSLGFAASTITGRPPRSIAAPAPDAAAVRPRHRPAQEVGT